MRRQQRRSSILIKMNQKPILKKNRPVDTSGNSDVTIWRWCRQRLEGGSGGRGMNLLLYVMSCSATAPPGQRCAHFIMSITNIQRVGTQVQANETEWMKWTKIVFFPAGLIFSNGKCPYLSLGWHFVRGGAMQQQSVQWCVTEATSTSWDEWMSFFLFLS